MPETDVIFKFEAVDDLSPVLDKIKTELDKIGGGGGAPALERFGKEIEHTSFLTEQWKELTAGVGYNLGLWNAGMMASEAILSTVTDLLTKVIESQTLYMKQSYALAQTGPEMQAYFNELIQGGIEAAGSWDNLTKVFLPAIDAFRTIGMAEGEAANEAEKVAQYFHLTGTNLTSLVQKLDAGTASFHEMLAASKLLKPSTDAELQSLARMTDQEAHTARIRQQYEAQLAHEHEMERRQYQLDEEAIEHKFEIEQRTLDREYELFLRARGAQDRLREAREGFAQASGLTGQAFASFAGGAGARAVTAQIPAELANIPGMREAARNALGLMQQEFKSGSAQLAKELGIPLQSVLAAEKVQAALGKPFGFGEADVMGAAKRAQADKQRQQDEAEADRKRVARIGEEDRRRTSHLAEQKKEFDFQDEHWAREKDHQDYLNDLENKRVAAEERVAAAIKAGGEDSIKVLDAVIAQENHAKTLAGFWEEIQGNIAKSAASLSQITVEQATKPVSPGLAANLGIGAIFGGGAGDLLNYLMGGRLFGGKPGEAKDLATDSGQQKIVDAIDRNFNKLMGH